MKRKTKYFLFAFLVVFFCGIMKDRYIIQREFYFMTAPHPVKPELVFDFVRSTANPKVSQQSVAYGNGHIWVAYPSDRGTKRKGVIQEYNLDGYLLREINDTSIGQASSMCLINDSLYILSEKCYTDKLSIAVVDTKTGKCHKRIIKMPWCMVWDGLGSREYTLLFIGLNATQWTYRYKRSPHNVTDSVALCAYYHNSFVYAQKCKWIPPYLHETTQGIAVCDGNLVMLTSQSGVKRLSPFSTYHMQDLTLLIIPSMKLWGNVQCIHVPTYVCREAEGAFSKDGFLYFSIYKKGLYRLNINDYVGT